ncbi:MAG: hypothetical protein J6V44_09960 [Methanobrevibacter sp.]|nr:hypothetical protein [Methanobrevibacter sp.]
MNKKFEYVDDNPGSYFGMLVESFDQNNKLEEADTLAKPIKKDFKNRYKSYDRQKDYVNKHNQEMAKKIPANASEEDVEIIKDVFFKKEPKFDRSIGDNFKGLETKDYPFYVTYYQEVPFYHPEEGGYYVAGVQAMQSEGFDSKEEALKSLQDAASAWGMEKLSSTEYGNLSKYIGDSQYAVLETSKTYLSREEGDKQYESLKESKSNSKETAKDIAKQFGVNPKIVSTKLGYYKIPVKMLLGDFIKNAKDNNFINAGDKNRFYKDIDDATVFVEFDEKNGAMYVDFKYEKEESLKEDKAKRLLILNKKTGDWLRDGNGNAIQFDSEEKANKFINSECKNNVDKYKVVPLRESKFVPKDKMSKKAQKELNDKKRGTWGNTNPVTKVQPNKKAYDRKRDKKELDEALDNRFSDIVKKLENIYVDMKYRANISDKDVLHYYNKLKNILETLHEYL